MTLQEFYAIGGTNEHLKDPEFDVTEFMTNLFTHEEILEALDYIQSFEYACSELFKKTNRSLGSADELNEAMAEYNEWIEWIDFERITLYKQLSYLDEIQVIHTKRI